MKSIRYTLLFLLSLPMSIVRADDAKRGTVEGRVQTPTGEALPGATVQLLNTAFAAVADKDGTFRLTHVPTGAQVLVVSLLGYATQQQPISVQAGQTQTLTLRLAESTTQLDEVVVSAQRTEQASVKVPVAVTTLNAKQIQAARIWRFDDLTAIAPNFHISPAGGGYYLMSVRGINSYSKIPAVVTYVDDVPIFNGYIMGYNVQDVERMEFLRGPQGTLFGRGASGGVLTIKTKQPTNTVSGFGEVSLGNNNQQRYNLGIRTPLVKDKLFFSASGVYSRINGFFTNQLDNRRVGDETAVGGNVKLSFVPNSNWLIHYDLRGETSEQKGSLTRSPNKEQAFSQPYVVNVDRIGSTKRDFLTHALSVNYFGRGFTVKSISAYQDVRLRYDDCDLDNSPLDYQYYYTPSTQPSKTFTQEIRVSSATDDGKRLAWTAGLFYFHSNEVDDIAYAYGKDGPPLDLGNGTKLPPPYSNVTYSTTKSNGFAVYGQLTFKITPRTELLAGLRYDSERAALITRSDFAYPGQPVQTVLPATEVNTSFGAVLPKASLVQLLGERSSVYASYSRGYRPGGVNPYTSDPRYLSFKPEFSNNVEAGYKATALGNRLRWNLTAFLITLKEQQLYTITSGFNFATLNIGDITSRGLESELSYLLAKGLQVDWNLGLTKARYTQLPYFRFNQQGQPEGADFTDNQPIQSPVTTSFLALNYQVALTKKVSASLRGEWKYLGKQYFDYANTIEQPAFSTFNTRVGVAYGKTELAFWVRNLADKKYLTYAYPFLLTAAQLANPLTLGFTLSTRF
jgi:iron complex outermembrane receptor protein